jgi:protein O-mannosyl-transferase
LQNVAAPAQEQQPARRIVAVRLWALSALLFCCTIALYYPAVHHAFLNYDDDQYVTANPNVRSGLTSASVEWAFSNLDIGHWEPVTWISHLADCSLYGMRPAGHHFSSVLLHAVNVCLLFALLYWITGSAGRSLVVAALFAVHPTNTEVVAWIAERKTLICTLFTFGTFAAYVWYALRPNVLRYLLVLFAFVWAVMSKSMAVTIPVLLLLVDYWILGRWKDHPARCEAIPRVSQKSAARLLLEKAPLFAIAAAVSLLTLHAQEKGHAVNHDALGPRLAHAAWSYMAYVVKLVWPSDLSILYPYPAHGHPAWIVALAVIALVAISIVVCRAKTMPYLAFGWFFYVLAMLPVIGIVRVGPQSLSDHYLYVPAIGLFVLAVWGIADVMSRFAIREEIRFFVGVAVIGGYALVTIAYLPSWQNSYTLFARAEKLSAAPDDLIETNLADGLRELGRPSEAIPHYQRAIALAPQMPLPRCNVGSILIATGDVSEAIEQFEAALQQNPSGKIKSECLSNLAVAYLVLNDTTKAEQSFTAALAASPDFEHALVGRGMIRYQRRDLQGAAEDLSRAVTLEPDPVAFYWLGKSLAAQGETEAAVAAFRRSLILAPGRREVQIELETLTRGATAPPAQ